MQKYRPPTYNTVLGEAQSVGEGKSVPCSTQKYTDHLQWNWAWLAQEEVFLGGKNPNRVNTSEEIIEKMEPWSSRQCMAGRLETMNTNSNSVFWLDKGSKKLFPQLGQASNGIGCPGRMCNPYASLKNTRFFPEKPGLSPAASAVCRTLYWRSSELLSSRNCLVALWYFIAIASLGMVTRRDVNLCPRKCL